MTPRPLPRIEETGSVDWDFYEQQERAWEDAQEAKLESEREDPSEPEENN